MLWTWWRKNTVHWESMHFIHWQNRYTPTKPDKCVVKQQIMAQKPRQRQQGSFTIFQTKAANLKQSAELNDLNVADKISEPRNHSIRDTIIPRVDKEQHRTAAAGASAFISSNMKCSLTSICHDLLLVIYHWNTCMFGPYVQLRFLSLAEIQPSKK